jgi:hypothetical protein
MTVQTVGLPRPQLIVVHDFGVTASDVTLDGAIGARLLQMIREAPTSGQELQLGREVARAVTANLVKEIHKLGIPAVPAAVATPVAGPSLAIDGHFLSVGGLQRVLRRRVLPPKLANPREAEHAPHQSKLRHRLS